MSKKSRSFLAALLLFSALFFSLALSTSVHALVTGRLFGQVLNGTRNNAPVAGQSVTLQLTQGNTTRDLKSVKTDARGAFAFSDLATSRTMTYALSTRYQGAPYTTALIDLSSRPVQSINLTVYQATANPARIVIDQAIVSLNMPAGQGGVLTVSNYFFLKNSGTQTYVGSLDASSSQLGALRFSLPRGARRLSLANGFAGAHVTIQPDSSFVTDAAVPPGVTPFGFSFDLPYAAANENFPYAAIYPTQQLSVLVPANLPARSATLSSLGVLVVNQNSYTLFRANNLRAGKEVYVQLDNLPVPRPAPYPSALSQESLWLVVGLVMLLAALFVMRFLSRFSSQSASGTQRGRDVGAGQDSFADQQQELLKELLALDTAFAAGKLPQGVYQKRRARTRRQLRALMSIERMGKRAGSGGQGEA